MQQINVLCTDYVGLNIYSNTATQTMIHIFKKDVNNNNKILKLVVENIFNLYNLKKPFFFCNTSELLKSLKITSHTKEISNCMLISMYSNDKIYKIKIQGICDSDIYYLGTNRETINNMIKALKTSYKNLNGKFIFRNMELTEDTPLTNCMFVEKYSFNNVTFIRNMDTKEKKDNVIKPQRKSIPKKIKEMTWNKWIGKEKGTEKCVCCNDKEISQLDFECGHIISVNDGGHDEVDNLRPICKSCNRSMGTQNMKEFIQTYKLKGSI